MAWLLLLKKFGPYLAVVLLIVGIYACGHSRGASKWKDKFETEEFNRKKAVAGLDQAQSAVVACDEATRQYKKDANARITQLEEKLQREPEIITRYRDRVEVVERIIQSEDCVTALAEVAEVLEGVDPP